MKSNSKSIILIKLGGSIITDKNIPYKARPGVIRRLAKEIKNSASTSIIIANGNGSFGHTSAQKYGGKKGYKSKLGVAKVARDVMELNKIIIDSLIEVGLPAIYLRPISLMTTDAGKLKEHLFSIVEEAVKQKLVPSVSGDIILDSKWKTTIYSGETILNEIGLYLIKQGFRIGKIIQVGQTDGVYDKKGNTVSVINKDNWGEIKNYLFKNKATDVSGGMKHKIENALVVATVGISTFLINGNRVNELSNALLGKAVRGTIIREI